MQQQREEKIKWLNEAQTTEIIKNIQFLNPEQQKYLYKEFVRKVAFFQFNTDDDDKKYMNHIVNRYLIILICPFPFKLINHLTGPKTQKFQSLAPTVQKLVRLLTIQRGLIPSSIILVDSVIKIMRISSRIGYKHYLIEQMDKQG